ncbi:hypothetical protein PMI36_04201 [Pseudomonas sp. GM79]|uniref:DUF6896 domain-containing protein n=1 Tax=Pseudomonas sp. GM79 TaxID=1144338 RepID=UPI00026F596F|nr:hypothetical protein [Pseudomonas sp. GM79]EJN20394.1 hypothetical protein PMI36_04201 [Pseudomonas sp. GM79]
MKNKDLECLVDDFLIQVDRATDLLEKKFGRKCILRLWRLNEIPQRGIVTDGVSYELHGVGCRVSFPEVCVDFDYGPDERVDGFDIWRLYVYACEVPSLYPKYTDQSVLERDFKEYIRLGKVERVSGSLSSLYFKNKLRW